MLTMNTSAFTRSRCCGVARQRVGLRVRAQRLGDDVPRLNQGRKLNVTGFVETDETGKSNVFPRMPTTFIKSETSEQAASVGLGGSTGAILISSVAGIVAVAAVYAFTQQSGDTLGAVASVYSGDSLSTIAQRIASTL